MTATTSVDNSRDLLRRYRTPLALVVLALMAVVYFVGVPENPPGFFVDESSIAYNAHSIAQRGSDEHGVRWPLYFRAFGEYKSPVYIYMLAALYKFTGPSIGVARGLSAALGVLAALLLGLLAARVEQRRGVGFVIALSALATPWLFETSRLVFEVALFPLALVLFLLALRRALKKERWSWLDAGLMAAALALITYTYSAGRLLAPLLAVGLVLCATRARMRGILRTWVAYGVTLLPLFVFGERNPGALGSRFADVSFITPQSTWAEIALRFITNYVGNFNPWNWLVAGDPEPRHHVQMLGSVLVGTFVLFVGGLLVVVWRHRREAWWRFVLYGLLVSPVPTSLTVDRFHTLRLIALPVFVLVVCAPAVAWLLEDGGGASARRATLGVLVFLTVLQGGIFWRQFRLDAPNRRHNFDAFYTQVFDAATALPDRPIYIIDNVGAPGYMHALWYATLRGMDTSQFVRLPKDAQPPPGALVISTEMPCTNCRIILERASFRAYIAGR